MSAAETYVMPSHIAYFNPLLLTLGWNCLVVTIVVSVLGDLQEAVPHVMVLAPQTSVFTKLLQSLTEKLAFCKL